MKRPKRPLLIALVIGFLVGAGIGWLPLPFLRMELALVIGILLGHMLGSWWQKDPEDIDG